jgi:hypothetical protein
VLLDGVVTLDQAAARSTGQIGAASGLPRVNQPWTAEAIKTLGVAFPWDQTLEGEAFWFEIAKRSDRIKDRGHRYAQLKLDLSAKTGSVRESRRQGSPRYGRWHRPSRTRPPGTALGTIPRARPAGRAP